MTREERQALIAQMQAGNENRARLQAGEMVFIAVDGCPGQWYCAHTFMETRTRQTTHIYQVSETECECDHFRFRCLYNGIKCKHQIALRDYLRRLQEFQTEMRRQLKSA